MAEDIRIGMNQDSNPKCARITQTEVPQFFGSVHRTFKGKYTRGTGRALGLGALVTCCPKKAGALH